MTVWEVTLSVLLLLAEGPGGWRVVDDTEVPDRADAFLEAQPSAR